MFIIFTEHRANIEQVVARLVKGATITHGLGLWQESTEACTRIELVGIDRHEAEAVASAIKCINNQDAVLLVELTGTHTFI